MGISMITVNGRRVVKDEQGRFSLNDLRVAGAGDKNKLPSQWLRKVDVQISIENMKKITKFKYELIVVRRVGAVMMTFAHKKIAIEYADSLSPAFKVNFLEAIKPKYKRPISKAIAIKDTPRKNTNLPDALIQTDEDGRINLNVLFNRSGASFYKRPSLWILQEPTVILAASLRKSNKDSTRPINVTWEGLNSTVYAEPQLALRYASWVGAHLAFKISDFILKQHGARSIDNV